MSDYSTGTEVQTMVFDCIESMRISSSKKRLVFKPAPFGLGGQVTGRIYAILVALALGRKVAFIYEDDPPYGQTFDLDLLLDPAATVGAVGVDVFRAQDDDVVVLDPLAVQIGSREKERICELLGVLLGLSFVPRFEVLEGAVFNWLPVTPRVLMFCADAKERLGVSRSSLGVHLRRGDKRVESPYVPAREVNAVIKRIYQSWQFTEIYLASDSPDAASEIVCPPGVRLLFDREEKRYNNANHRMLLDSPELAEQETLSAFKNLYLLASCGGVVGQDNAHFATIATSSVIASGGARSRSALVDGALRERQSRMVAAFYSTKRMVRAALRKALPSFTAAERLKSSRRLP